MISFEPLAQLLKIMGMPKTILKRDKIVGGRTFDIISKGMREPIKEGISISTIDDICKAFDCQPQDIMEYIPEGK